MDIEVDGPLASGANSPSSTASGSTDQFCSVRVSGLSIGGMSEADNKVQQGAMAAALEGSATAGAQLGGEHELLQAKGETRAQQHIDTTDLCTSPSSQQDSTPATTPTPSTATASSFRNSGSSTGGSRAGMGSAAGSFLEDPPAAAAAGGGGGGGGGGAAVLRTSDSSHCSSYSSGSALPQTSSSAAATAAAAAAANTGSFSSTSSSVHQLLPPTAAQPSAAAAAGGGGGGGALRQSCVPPSQQSFSSSSSMPQGMAGAGSPYGVEQHPPLVQQLGVSVESLSRLFRADADTEFEQPVWMVINLQGKIKGSYTAEKMVEFCRRGTLGGAQLVLGLDRNLPYQARQELSYYRPLSHLVIGVHHGARYSPLTETAVSNLARQGLAATQWEPLVSPDQAGTSGDSPSDTDTAAAAVDSLAAGLQQGLDLQASSAQGAAALAAGSSRVAAMAAAARLRSVLQRLCCGSGVRMTGGARPSMGRRQTPLWMYINHLGWCRGPFSGGKVIQAHMCGRLPHDTLVVGLEPDVPPALISNDVEYWFRPLKFLIEQVAAGYTYNPVSWTDVAAYSLSQQGGQQAPSPQWQPLVYRDMGAPPPFQGGPQPAISNTHNPAAAAAGASSSGNSGLTAHLMQQAQQVQSPASGSGGPASPDMTGAIGQGHTAAAAAGGLMLPPSAAGPPESAAASPQTTYSGVGQAYPGSEAVVSQALLMTLLQQPQQQQQQQQQQWQADANAAMPLHYPVQMPGYDMYTNTMQQQQGALGHSSSMMAGHTDGTSGVWDPNQHHQHQPQQQAMLGANAMAMMAAGGLQWVGSSTSSQGGPVMYQTSSSSAALNPQGQQLWGQQLAPGSAQHSMPHGGWAGGMAGGGAAGPGYPFMQQGGRSGRAGDGCSPPDTGLQQGLLQGFMGNVPFLQGPSNMQ